MIFLVLLKILIESGFFDVKNLKYGKYYILIM